MTSWGVAEVKAKFSEVMEKVLTEGPQEVTRRGKDSVVMVRKDEWDRLSRPKRNAAEFFLNSPLHGSGVKLERIRGKARPVKL